MLRKLFVSVTVVAVAVFGDATTVWAAPATDAGTASAGSAQVVREGHTITVPAIAGCSLTGTSSGSSQGSTRPGVVSYGPASATCTADQASQTSRSQATGSAFALTALESYGGPQIKIGSYQVTCTATTKGTNASWEFSGLTGLTVPQQVPNDYVLVVRNNAGQLLADVILNEVILPNPNDGSITLNMIHIILFPNGVPAGALPMSGNVYVGSTACSPTV